MRYNNICPITREEITIENSFLVKVPVQHQKASTERDVYYYIADAETLENLIYCPLTRRDNFYYFIKLSDIKDIEKILLKKKENTLIDENDALIKIDNKNKLEWKQREFKKVTSSNNTNVAQTPQLTTTANIISMLNNSNNNPQHHTQTHAQNTAIDLPYFIFGTQGSPNSLQQQVNQLMATIANNNSSGNHQLFLLGDDIYPHNNSNGNIIDFDLARFRM